nr:helix-turn-helix transcriptional regulator [Fictibacillus sp. 7GRE50]
MEIQHNNILGSHLKYLRDQKGWDRKALAEKLGVSASYIGLIETNKRLPSTEKLDRYANVFDVSLKELELLLEKQKAADGSNIQDEACEQRDLNVEDISLLEHFLNQLNNVQKTHQTDIIEKCQKILYDHFRANLQSYTLPEVIALVKTEFTSCGSTNDPFNEQILEGIFTLSSEHEVYFRLSNYKQTITLELPYEYKDYLPLFEDSIGPHDFILSVEENTPYLFKQRDCIQFTWFSPVTSLQQQFDILYNSNVNYRDIVSNSLKLEWYIQQKLERFDFDLVK